MKTHAILVGITPDILRDESLNPQPKMYRSLRVHHVFHFFLQSCTSCRRLFIVSVIQYQRLVGSKLCQASGDWGKPPKTLMGSRFWGRRCEGWLLMFRLSILLRCRRFRNLRMKALGNLSPRLPGVLSLESEPCSLTRPRKTATCSCRPPPCPHCGRHLFVFN